MSARTGVNSYDLVSTMQELGIIKYWKGKHIILRKQVSLSCVVFRSISMKNAMFPHPKVNHSRSDRNSMLSLVRGKRKRKGNPILPGSRKRLAHSHFDLSDFLSCCSGLDQFFFSSLIKRELSAYPAR